MPEGPELCFLGIYYNKLLKNQVFQEIISNTKSIVNLPSKSHIEDIYSYGKNLIIKTKSYFVVIHLGITGWLVENKPKIFKYVFEFSKNTIYLQDRRRFSKLLVFNTKNELEQYLQKFGRDILSNQFTLEYFQNIIQSKNKLLCSLLLDQTYFAGLGNYIKNDALYLSGIHPNVKTQQLTIHQIKNLYQNIRFIAFSNLYSWCDIYNIKVPNYIAKIAPKKLQIPYTFKVYEREYDDNGDKIVFMKKHCGRRTYYVPSKQKNY